MLLNESRTDSFIDHIYNGFSECYAYECIGNCNEYIGYSKTEILVDFSKEMNTFILERMD